MGLIVSPAAAKELAELPRRDGRALFVRVETFAADPFGAQSWARPLRGREGRLRIRHGDGRALCWIDRVAEAVVLERVDHRREVYR